MRLLIAATALLWSASAWAQTPVALSDCSQSVTTGSVAVTFPASGGTGPTFPSSYLEICNGHASQTLGVRASGGTAAIGSAGTLTLNPGGCAWWAPPAPVPASVSIIGSGAATVTACWYH